MSTAKAPCIDGLNCPDGSVIIDDAADDVSDITRLKCPFPSTMLALCYRAQKLRYVAYASTSA